MCYEQIRQREIDAPFLVNLFVVCVCRCRGCCSLSVGVGVCDLLIFLQAAAPGAANETTHGQVEWEEALPRNVCFTSDHALHSHKERSTILSVSTFRLRRRARHPTGKSSGKRRCLGMCALPRTTRFTYRVTFRLRRPVRRPTGESSGRRRCLGMSALLRTTRFTLRWRRRRGCGAASGVRPTTVRYMSRRG